MNLEEAIEAGKLTIADLQVLPNCCDASCCGNSSGTDYDALVDAAHAKAVSHLAWWIVEWLEEQQDLPLRDHTLDAQYVYVAFKGMVINQSIKKPS